MAQVNYGKSFGNKKVESPVLERIALWDRIDEKLLVGATLKAGGSYPEGTVIPAGTPASVDKLGGTITLNSETPEGLTENDVVMGSEFATFSIVKRGIIYVDRTKATISEAQKKALPGITFVKELED